MVAKVITHSNTLEDALKIMERALYEVTVEGVETNIDLLEALVSDRIYRLGQSAYEVVRNPLYAKMVRKRRKY